MWQERGDRLPSSHSKASTVWRSRRRRRPSLSRRKRVSNLNHTFPIENVSRFEIKRFPFFFGFIYFQSPSNKTNKQASWKRRKFGCWRTATTLANRPCWKRNAAAPMSSPCHRASSASPLDGSKLAHQTSSYIAPIAPSWNLYVIIWRLSYTK